MNALKKSFLFLAGTSRQLLFLIAKWSIIALVISLVLLFFYFVKNLLQNKIEALELFGIIIIQTIALIFLYVSINKIKKEIETKDFLREDID